MKHPSRRILSFYERQPKALAPGGPYTPGGFIVGTRTFELQASCGHIFAVDLMPSERSGTIEIPKIAPCPLCPLVPDARANDYVEGGTVPQIASVP